MLLHLAMATKSGQIYVELVGATDKNEPKTIRWDIALVWAMREDIGTRPDPELQNNPGQVVE